MSPKNVSIHKTYEKTFVHDIHINMQTITSAPSLTKWAPIGPMGGLLNL